MKLAVISLFALAVVGVTQAITCNNCKGDSCETGTCSGDYCVDKYSYNALIGSHSYQRGCYTPEAGHANKPSADVYTDGDFDCSASVLNQLTESFCLCGTDKCNKGALTVGNTTKGPVECALGSEGSVTGKCTGDYCVWGQGILGIGCQYNEGYENQAVYSPGSPPAGKAVCYRTHKSDGTNKNEQCTCDTANCNAAEPKVSYSRMPVTCEETVTFSNQVKSCQGSACYITGVFVSAVNGYERGCIDISGDEPIMPFCNNARNGGAASDVETCLCLTENCNTDIDTAKASMTTTTTEEPQTTTHKTTHKPSGATGLSASLLAVATGIFLRCW